MLNVLRFLFSAVVLLISVQGHAVGYPGLKENVMLSCGSGAREISIISENYTTRIRGELAGKPGQLATAVIKSDISAPFGNRHSITSTEPLELVRATGWIDRVIGLYENDNYVLEISGRKPGQIELRVKATGEVLQCAVLGDCC
ncbi:MAG: hypothetical protein EOP05_04890 [Proteobacteria bacterium]|nr:MAG: hypothetical protein EOP05_04890 [Pseudomonadota bacterium]